MEHKQRVLKIGNSIGLTIPSDFVRSTGIKAGDMVEVKKNFLKGEVIYQFAGIRQLPIDENFLSNKKSK